MNQKHRQKKYERALVRFNEKAPAWDEAHSKYIKAKLIAEAHKENVPIDSLLAQQDLLSKWEKEYSEVFPRPVAPIKYGEPA